jgi:hypothetical protein
MTPAGRPLEGVADAEADGGIVDGGAQFQVGGVAGEAKVGPGIEIAVGKVQKDMLEGIVAHPRLHGQASVDAGFAVEFQGAGDGSTVEAGDHNLGVETVDHQGRAHPDIGLEGAEGIFRSGQEAIAGIDQEGQGEEAAVPLEGGGAGALGEEVAVDPGGALEAAGLGGEAVALIADIEAPTEVIPDGVIAEAAAIAADLDAADEGRVDVAGERHAAGAGDAEVLDDVVLLPGDVKIFAEGGSEGGGGGETDAQVGSDVGALKPAGGAAAYWAGAAGAPGILVGGSMAPLGASFSLAS